jgi:cardiolipin synthase
MFLLDVRHAGDPGGLVRELVRALRDAAARRVDVRVMVGDSSRVLNLRDAAMVSRAFLRSRGIPTRVYPGTRGGGTHEKCVIVDDDLAILGSHNWWGESLAAAAEESLALRSPDLVAMLAGKFTDVWTAPGPGKKRDAAAGAAARREEGR